MSIFFVFSRSLSLSLSLSPMEIDHISLISEQQSRQFSRKNGKLPTSFQWELGRRCAWRRVALAIHAFCQAEAHAGGSMESMQQNP